MKTIRVFSEVDGYSKFVSVDEKEFEQFDKDMKIFDKNLRKVIYNKEFENSKFYYLAEFHGDMDASSMEEKVKQFKTWREEAIRHGIETGTYENMLVSEYTIEEFVKIGLRLNEIQKKWERLPAIDIDIPSVNMYE